MIRNRLALGRQVTTIPEDLDLDPYLRHEYHRVRVEALPLELRVPERRVHALSEAVHYPDPRVVTRALRALSTAFPDGLPDPLLPALEGLLSPGPVPPRCASWPWGRWGPPLRPGPWSC